MTSIEDTVQKFKLNEFHIQHPYADFKFRTGTPLVCGGSLCVSVWELKGKISFDGVKWYNIEGLNPNDTDFINYFYDCMFNEYGWVYQDIYATFNEEIKESVFKKFKIISISNKPVPETHIYECRDIPQMDRKLLLKLDHAKRVLSEEFNVSGVSLTDEQIININLIVEGFPSIDLIETLIDEKFNTQLFDIEKKIAQILNSIDINRFTIGKINIH